MPPKTGPTASAINKIIRKNLARLRKPGVLTVRPGFEITKQQLTGKSAIVATVQTKAAGLPKSVLLPNAIGSIPVDVREATPQQRLRAHDPAAAALVRTFGLGRLHDQAPTWPFEREMPSGRLLKDPKDLTRSELAKVTAKQPATQKALAAHAKREKIDYVPANVPLDPVLTTTTITAHASPDAGLVTLQNFLAGTKKSLVIGMYDFTSGTILKNFEDILVGKRTLKMVLDNPAPNDTRDQTDTQTVQDLNTTLGTRSKIVRALDNKDIFVSKWMFPFAYHIKVIVRDGTAFWLSSGNLNNSNQPDLSSPIVHKRDRDWHVIIEDENLAKVFAAYLNQDFASAKQFQVPQPGGPTATAISDAHSKLAAETNPPPPPSPKAPIPGRVPAKVFKDISVKITPLLTPDKLPDHQPQYLTNIINLISSATKSLFIQLQYIESSNGTGDNYDKLLQAIADRVAAGVDVRLIEDSTFGLQWIEKMKQAGVDLTANISTMEAVHNKGFVVDSRSVVVSSQNFSPAGVETNRDAGVIIESEDIAQYFEPIFRSDWQKAKPAVKTSAKRSKPKTRIPRKPKAKG
jgi:hypothetical protein